MATGEPPAIDPDDVHPEVRSALEHLLGMIRSGRAPEEVRGAQYDAGLAWVWFPRGWGGLGIGADAQEHIDATLAAAGLSAFDETSSIGVSMSAPTLAGHGTDEQKARFLRRIFTSADVWCQLFSEPGSGSDLAGLSTRAERDGDTWIINGQKVWTSFADIADWALILARHDPTVPKHAGLTYFAVDMHSPGVELRPLREMTGDGQFSEVFLTDVRIPDAQRVGPVGQGWRVALDTLSNERAGRGDPLGSGAIDHARRLWAEHGGRQSHSGAQRDRLALFYVRSEVVRLMNERGYQLREAGTPGPEGSLAKLAAAELGQAIYSFCIELSGADGMLMPGGYPNGRIAKGQSHLVGRGPAWLFLRSKGFTIEGGTAQIQRNVIAERILGLPGDGRSERTTPWSEIPRS